MTNSSFYPQQIPNYDITTFNKNDNISNTIWFNTNSTNWLNKNITWFDNNDNKTWLNNNTQCTKNNTLFCNNTNHHNIPSNETNDELDGSCVRLLVPPIFVLIVVVGFVGNIFVMLTVIMNKKMRSTTNILIFNLALADLLFILICVPSTGERVSLVVWIFFY